MSESHPNILWILCDELRTDALSCYGAPLTQIRTPHIDRLASEGTLFEQFFVNSPVCLPSRTSFLTGLYPEQTGAYHNEAFAPEFPLPSGTTTFVERASQEGYHTANFGKVHVPKALTPFQESNSEGSTMSDVYNPEQDSGSVIRLPEIDHVVSGVFDREGPFPPSRLTDNVIRFLTENVGSDRPYLVCASYLQPHTPVVPPEPFASRYSPDLFPDHPEQYNGLSRFEQRFADIVKGDQLDPRSFQRAQAAYHGLVAWLDEEIGRLLQAIDELDRDRDLLVVFTADHGAYLGENGAFGKHTFAPQCQRAPLLVRGPGVIPGLRRDDLAQGVDIAPTILGRAGIRWRGPGRDLFSSEPVEAVFGTIGFGGSSSLVQPVMGTGRLDDDHAWPRRACIRTADYRLDMNIRVDGERPPTELEDRFLADVRSDPAEIRNLAGEPAYEPVLKELVGLLEAHIANSVEIPDEIVSGLFARSGRAGDSR